MFLEARPTANMSFVRSQIISAVDLIVQIVRFPDGRRRIVKISEPEKRVEESGVVSMLDLFEFQRNVNVDNPMDSSGEYKAVSASLRSTAKMLQNGVVLDKNIFNNEFTVTREMLVDELRNFHPNRMCGWKPNYMSEIVRATQSSGKNLLERWPNLQ